MKRTNNLTGHGSAADRGSADAYYGRGHNPHYFTGGSYNTPRVEREAMTPEEVAAYTKAYENEGERKEWD